MRCHDTARAQSRRASPHKPPMQKHYTVVAPATTTDSATAASAREREREPPPPPGSPGSSKTSNATGLSAVIPENCRSTQMQVCTMCQFWPLIRFPISLRPSLLTTPLSLSLSFSLPLSLSVSLSHPPPLPLPLSVEAASCRSCVRTPKPHLGDWSTGVTSVNLSGLFTGGYQWHPEGEPHGSQAPETSSPADRVQQECSGRRRQVTQEAKAKAEAKACPPPGGRASPYLWFRYPSLSVFQPHRPSRPQPSVYKSRAPPPPTRPPTPT